MQIYIFIEPKFRPDKHHLCTGSRSNESSQQNLAEKLVYFAGCRLLSTTPSPHSSLYSSCDTDCTIFILSQDENYCFWSKMSPKPFILTPCHPEQGAITSQLNSQLLIQNKSPFCKKQTKKSSFLWKFNPFKQKLCLNQSCQLNVLKKVCPDYPKNNINLLTLTQNIYQHHLLQNNSNTLSNLHETVVSSFASA